MRRARVAVALLLMLAAASAAGAQSTSVEFQVRPTKLKPIQNALLLGRVSSGRTGETVTIQAKYCTQSTFSTLVAVQTAPGGTFRIERSLGMNATLRARWGEAVSQPVLLRQAPLVQLDQTSARRFEVGVGSLGLMWRKRVQIQRRTGSRWQLARTVTLTETHAGPGSSGVWTNADFSLSVPVGTSLRAVLSAEQARPCYLGAASSVIRTTEG